jgi:glycosyltransferase involved in cell wall biosynthesis
MKNQLSDNNELPLISIVIPNYNNEIYLEKAISSCLNQTYKNLEVLIVDDCSTDKSVELIREIQKNDARLKLIQNDVNLKVTRTRNKGILAANGIMISTLDSDDYFTSDNKIETEFNLLKKHNFDIYTIAYSGIVRVDPDEEVLGYIMNKQTVAEGKIFIELLTRSCAIPRDFLFFKKLFEEVNGFDLDLPIYEDWDLKIRMSRLAEFYYTGSNGIAYRQLDSGLSKTKRKERMKWLEFVFDKNSSDLENKQELRNKLLSRQSFISRIFKRITKKITGANAHFI